MSALGDRIRQAREARGWDQTQLGNEVGYEQPTISDIESGATSAPRKWREMADALDIPREEFRELMILAGRESGKTTRLPAAVREAMAARLVADPGITQTPTVFAAPPSAAPNARVVGAAPEMDRDAVPVYGRACGGDDGKYEFNGEVIGWAPRPANLRGVPGVYAVYIDGESMYPRYKSGETAIAQPGRSIAKGDDVIVQLAPDNESDSPFGFVKEFVGYTPTKIILSQFNPVKRIEFDRDRVVSVHRIVHADR